MSNQTPFLKPLLRLFDIASFYSRHYITLYHHHFRWCPTSQLLLRILVFLLQKLESAQSFRFPIIWSTGSTIGNYSTHCNNHNNNTFFRQRDDFLLLWLVNRIQIMKLESKEWESLNPGSHLASDNKLDINMNLKKNLDETKIN